MADTDTSTAFADASTKRVTAENGIDLNAFLDETT
jgi:hypothetical protein